MNENASEEYTLDLTVGDLKNIAIVLGVIDRSLLEITEQDTKTLNDIKVRIVQFLTSIGESL